MFDVGFSELVVIALVALIVIGPERLPKVARTVGILLGRLQRYVNDVKSDINREIHLDELKKMQEQVTSETKEITDSLSSEMRSIENALTASIVPTDPPVADTPDSSAIAEVHAEPEPAAPAETVDPVAHSPEHQLELGFDSTTEKAKG